MTAQVPTARQRKATRRIFERERRHSRNVRRLKILLPLSACLLMAVLVGQSLVSSLVGGSIDLIGSSISGGRLIMANPTVAGVTATNRPYEMTAERAIQNIAEPDMVELERISARLPLGASEWADIAADSGVMDRKRNLLDITSPAELRTSDGLVARFRTAALDMGSGDLTSGDPVTVDFDGSEVTADGVRVSDGGSVITFTENVKVLIQARQLRTAAATGAGNVEN